MPYHPVLSVLACLGTLPQSHPTDTPSSLDALGASLEGEGWLACRVVDAISGQPIARAEILRIAESPTPVPGRLSFSTRATSDALGFAALPLEEGEGSWFLVRAPGYGPASCHDGTPGLVWPLAPALDVPVRVHDWLDRPVPGAGVGFCVGCGHTPDVANATADEEGIALVRGIDPWNDIADFYPEHPGLGVEDHGGVFWTPGDPPAPVRASYAEPAGGTVLGPSGKPVADAFVGAPAVHRGPWTRTAADGSFQLNGAPAGADLVVVLPASPDHQYRFERPWESPLTLRLPEPNGENVQAIDLPRATGPVGHLQLRLEGPSRQTTFEGAPLCIGPLPARHRNRASGTDSGAFSFELVAGTYEVHCQDEGFAELVARVELIAGEPQALTLHPTPLPTVRIEAPTGSRVALLRRGEGTDITKQVENGAPVPVPTDERFGLALRRGSETRIQSFTVEEARRQQPLVLSFLPPTRLAARLVDEEDAPVAATVALLPRDGFRNAGFPDLLAFEGSATDGTVELMCTAVGSHLLAIRPERSDLRPFLVPVSLPLRGENAAIDLGRLRLSGEPSLRILGSNGGPYRGARPGITRPGLHDVRDRPPAFPLDESGAWLGLEPREGDAIVVPAARWSLEASGDGDGTIDVPFRTVLSGEGPWTLSVPPGEVHVEVLGSDGQPLAAELFVADRSIALRGSALLRQLPAGPCEVIVAAAGHRAVRATVEVPAQGRGELRLRLEAR